MSDIEAERIEAAREYVRELVRISGVPKAARALGIGADSVTRLFGGLPVNRGTLEIVIARMASAGAVTLRSDTADAITGRRA